MEEFCWHIVIRKMKTDIKEEVKIPEKTEVKIEKGMVSVKGPKGELHRKLIHPGISLSIKENKIMIEAKQATKREKRLIGTFEAHINNMLKGVLEGYTYKLKICPSHFPMTASVDDNRFFVKNFLGETTPRTFSIKMGVDVKIEGNMITVESVDKELAGQTAASIEQLCRITDKDRRIFQDGIYLVSKAGKDVK